MNSGMSLPPLPGTPGYAIRSSHLINQDFGTTLTPEEMLSVTMIPMQLGGGHPPCVSTVVTRDEGSKLSIDKNKFEINLDVKQFAPEELEVKAADGFIMIEAKHEEKEDEHGFISREFVRRYRLPAECDPEQVESMLTSDGILTVVAPRISKHLKNERVVLINKKGSMKNKKPPGS